MDDLAENAMRANVSLTVQQLKKSPGVVRYGGKRSAQDRRGVL
jgi:hypothetical protein